MGIKEKLNKKPLKLLALLLTSMLITTVSAAVYYSLVMTSTIGTGTTDVYFVLGLDNETAGVTLSSDNQSAQLVSLKAYPNVTTTYDDPIRVKNNHTSSPFNVRLSHVELTGAATNFVFVNFTLMGTTRISLNYTSDTSSWAIPNDSGWVQMTAGDEWSILIETKAIAGAAADSVTIKIEVDVE